MTSPVPAETALAEALWVRRDGDDVRAIVHDGWDVFGIPHGGYLAALAGAAVLEASSKPDLFTITVHYLRKAALGDLRFSSTTVGGSRRFTTVQATATQDGTPVLAVMASVGDRAALQGPEWSRSPAWQPVPERLSPPADADATDSVGGSFTPPNIARRVGLQVNLDDMAFLDGVLGDGQVRAVMHPDPADQLAALLGCDITMPAVWTALGPKGWVPTVELTAHVRARPVEGPMVVEAVTTHVTDGFLNEDALVFDAAGQLVVQSRQLARWTAT